MIDFRRRRWLSMPSACFFSAVELLLLCLRTLVRLALFCGQALQLASAAFSASPRLCLASGVWSSRTSAPRVAAALYWRRSVVEVFELLVQRLQPAFGLDPYQPVSLRALPGGASSGPFALGWPLSVR